MNDAVNLLTGLGPNALLGAAVVYLWRELERAKAAHAEVQAARLLDAQSNTTKMLELYDRLHDDDRRSRSE